MQEEKFMLLPSPNNFLVVGYTYKLYIRGKII